MNFLITLFGVSLAYFSYRVLRKRLQRISKTGECFLCGQLFKDKYLETVGELSFCPDDLNYYNDNKWTEVKRVLSNPKNPEQSMKIYQKKLELLQADIRCFILTEYVEEDGVITSIFKLFAPSSEAERVMDLL